MIPEFTSIILVIPVVLILYIVFTSAFTVEEQSAVIIERFGKYLRVATSGLNFKLPIIDRKAGIVSLRVQQLDIKAETKTHDNVFVHLTVSVQYFVLLNKI